MALSVFLSLNGNQLVPDVGKQFKVVNVREHRWWRRSDCSGCLVPLMSGFVLVILSITLQHAFSEPILADVSSVQCDMPDNPAAQTKRQEPSDVDVVEPQERNVEGGSKQNWNESARKYVSQTEAERWPELVTTFGHRRFPFAGPRNKSAVLEVTHYQTWWWNSTVYDDAVIVGG